MYWHSKASPPLPGKPPQHLTSATSIGWWIPQWHRCLDLDLPWNPNLTTSKTKFTFSSKFTCLLFPQSCLSAICPVVQVSNMKVVLDFSFLPTVPWAYPALFSMPPVHHVVSFIGNTAARYFCSVLILFAYIAAEQSSQYIILFMWPRSSEFFRGSPLPVREKRNLLASHIRLFIDIQLLIHTDPVKNPGLKI